MPSRVRHRLPSRPENAREAGSRVWQYLVGAVRIDTRTLAMFRITIALIIIAEVILRFRNLHFFYSDAGPIPTELAMERTADWAFSFFYYTSDPTVVALLFALQILFAIQLLLGYRTRTAMVISFVFMASLDNGNPFIVSYSDVLFRMLLFWAMFVPLGDRWSVDAVHAEGERRLAVASPATALIIGQMVFMYTLNGYHKWVGSGWWDGTAAPEVLGRDGITWLLGQYSHHVTPLLEIGTYLWAILTLTAVSLVLVRGRYRYPLLAMFAGVHLTFAVTMRLGMFPYVAMAGLMLFLPRQFWSDVTWCMRRLGIDQGVPKSASAGFERFSNALPSFRLTPERLRSTVYTFFVGVIVITICFVLLLHGLQFAGVGSDADDHEREIERVAGVFDIDQPSWRLFAPNPATTDRYYVFAARTDEDRTLDIYHDRNMTWDRPTEPLHHQFDTYRERFYMNSIRSSGRSGDLSRALAAYLCENWTGPDGERLTHLNMWVVKEDVTMDTLADPDERDRSKQLIYRHGCDGGDKIIIGDHSKAP